MLGFLVLAAKGERVRNAGGRGATSARSWTVIDVGGEHHDPVQAGLVMTPQEQAGAAPAHKEP